jgi:hypothetical protein
MIWNKPLLIPGATQDNNPSRQSILHMAHMPGADDGRDVFAMPRIRPGQSAGKAHMPKWQSSLMSLFSLYAAQDI